MAWLCILGGLISATVVLRFLGGERQRSLDLMRAIREAEIKAEAEAAEAAEAEAKRKERKKKLASVS